MWNKTFATELLNVKYPIIQGPFGGRFSSVKLLSTVSNLGGLGSFGLNSFAAEEILEVGQEIKEATSKPYNLNLWVPLKNDPVQYFHEQDYENWKKVYATYFQESSLPLPTTMPKVNASNFDQQIEAVLKLAPPVLSFIFGIPPLEVIKEFKQRGTTIIAAATTLDEALLINETEIDLIIASGKEAGGHRPSFLKTTEESLNTTKDLVKSMLGKVKKPIIAAGGISNGQNAWEYLKLGASAVQLGTAFLATDESGATPEHKARLLSKDSFNTQLTKAFTGRLARAISNTFSDDNNSIEKLIYAPYPIQSELLSPLMKKYKENGLVDKVGLWAGEPSAVLKEQAAHNLFSNLIHSIEQLELR